MIGGASPLADDTDVDQFGAVDLRVARVLAAPLAVGTRMPSRVLTLDLGEHGERTSVAQLALVAEEDLVGSVVVACVNLGVRQIGRYRSEVLVLGAPHPDSPPDQAQALPLHVDQRATPGHRVF